MKAKIGNRLVASLMPQPVPYQVHDTELHGFLLRVQPSGVMTYYLEYRHPLTRRKDRIKIERHGKITPTQARDRAREIAADIVKGIDPKAARLSASVMTLRDFLDQVYEPWAKAELKGGKHYAKRIRFAFSQLLDRQLNDERLPWLIENWKQARLKSGAKKLTVNRDLATIRGAFSYAVKRQETTGLTKSPLAEVKLLRVSADESERVRYLNQHDPEE